MKITLKEYLAFLQKLETKSKELRTGQYFCNLYNITDPELFYSTNNEHIIEITTKKYVDFGET